MLFKNNSVIAAPMAGISDSVFRMLCRENGADIVFSEMVSVDAIVHGSRPTYDLMEFDTDERPIGIQLFGSDPERFKTAATLVTKRFNPDFIDLNSGCPVPKVTKKNGGASLLKNIQRFENILKALVTTVSLPVTVKLRSGWHKNEWVDEEFAQCAQVCGVAAITLHPRSQTMGFSDHSFWERIKVVKKKVAIPVIGNGDIRCGTDALDMVNQTGCDGIMIGRGAYGNPWIFAEAKASLTGGIYHTPSLTKKIETALRHLQIYRKKFGEYRAGKEMKKHIAWYCKGLTGASQLRDRIFRAATTKELEQALDDVIS